ncbi:hypothetical protein B0H13DRAFT_1917840 [Mycena leptocephala]|nr:hypothetical protein B0H13DRAFT_1917840 [Mycena leptocephala]
MAVSSSESIIWVDCEGEDEDFIEIVESIQPSRESVVCQPPPAQLHDFAPSGTRRRSQSRTPISRLSILPIKKAKIWPDCEGETPTTMHSHSLSRSNGRKKMALRGSELLKMKNAANSLSHVFKRWMKNGHERRIAPQNDARAVKTTPSLRMVSCSKLWLTPMGTRSRVIQTPTMWRSQRIFRRLSQSFMFTSGALVWNWSNVPSKSRTGHARRRDAAAEGQNCYLVCECQVGSSIRSRKELLAPWIDNSETNLFHGTAANNIQPILEGGFLIPSVSSGDKMVNGKTEGYGIYLASTAPLLLVRSGINKMFMCRVVMVEFQTKGASVGHFYVVKHVELALPRYVVEFDSQFHRFLIRLILHLHRPTFIRASFAFFDPAAPFWVGKVSAIKRGAAENRDVKGSTGKGKPE